MQHGESILQRNCVRWFRLVYREYDKLLFSVPNGARVSESQARVLRSEGLTKGVSDLILLVPNKFFHGMCIEMKNTRYTEKNGKIRATKTTQSPEQKAWQAMVQAMGYRYVVCHDFDEFRTYVEDYINDI